MISLKNTGFVHLDTRGDSISIHRKDIESMHIPGGKDVRNLTFLFHESVSSRLQQISNGTLLVLKRCGHMCTYHITGEECCGCRECELCSICVSRI